MATTHYKPMILNRDAMAPETEEALQNLWDSHPKNPTLAARIYIGSDGETDIAVNRLVEITPTGHEIHRLNTILSERYNQDALAKAIFMVSMDDHIEELLPSIQWENDAFDFQHGFIEMFIMPGVVRLAYPTPQTLAEDFAACLGMNEMDFRDPKLMNLGVFAAGKWKSNHEAMEITQKVLARKKTWDAFHTTFNQYTDDHLDKIILGNPAPILSAGSR